MLDGAKYFRTVPLGSVSLYGMELTLRVDEAGDWTLVDDRANERTLDASRGQVTVTLTPTPVYLVGKGQYCSLTDSCIMRSDLPVAWGRVSTPAPMRRVKRPAATRGLDACDCAKLDD